MKEEEKYFDYEYTYRYKTSEWVFYLKATSWDDAEARAWAIRTTCALDGRVMAVIPARVGGGSRG